MRFFTRGWACGDLNDEECEKVSNAYRARLEEIASQLPEAMLRLAREVSLHDGVIERVRWMPSRRRLELSVVCDACEEGYFLARLVYGGTLLDERRIAALRRAATSRETEVLSHEVDVSEDGVLTHRILFSPSEEVTLDFEQLELEVSPRADMRVELGGGFIEQRDEDADR